MMRTQLPRYCGRSLSIADRLVLTMDEALGEAMFATAGVQLPSELRPKLL